ncbi:MAG: 6,7-dimethyl-8-ribityllumazine synthase [Tenericutes bacterium HGW-Tenericutes-6]|nr:MAG: 6,7-dimethyl-8-ribityllumazine synthase [Tenericutes bacterium HGW-Tenericutes-6]
MKEFKGQLTGEGKKFALVISRFNEAIGKNLLSGAIDCLMRHQVLESNIDVYWTPGAFEIPSALSVILKKKKYTGVVALGVIIRGETPHFDFIASEVTKGIATISISTGVPIGFGIITADTVEQAKDRAGVKAGNKGWDSALSTLEMTDLIEQIK